MSETDTTFIGPPTKPHKVVKLATKPRAPSAVAASNDADLFRLIGQWRVHQCQAKGARAEGDVRVWFTESRDTGADTAVPLEREMERLEGQIVRQPPILFAARAKS